MIDVTDVLRQAMRDLKAEAEQTEDPEERKRIMYQVSCIGSTLAELRNPHPRAGGYDGISPCWFGPSNKKVKTKMPVKISRKK